jgi:hypothetical protein
MADVYPFVTTAMTTGISTVDATEARILMRSQLAGSSVEGALLMLSSLAEDLGILGSAQVAGAT